DRLSDGLHVGPLIRVGMLGAAILNASVLVGRQLPFHFFNQGREAGLRISLNRRRGGGDAPASAAAIAIETAESNVHHVALGDDGRKIRTNNRGLRAAYSETERVIVGGVRAGSAE